MAFILELSQASGRDVEVAYTTDDITATAGSDYTDNDGTATISAGQTSMQIEVALIDDSADEGTETLRFTLTSTGGHPKKRHPSAPSPPPWARSSTTTAPIPPYRSRTPSPVVEGSAASVRGVPRPQPHPGGHPRLLHHRRHRHRRGLGLHDLRLHLGHQRADHLHPRQSRPTPRLRKPSTWTPSTTPMSSKPRRSH